MTWWEDAACAGADEDDVEPRAHHGRGAPDRNATEDARVRAACAECPVTALCLADAMRYETGGRHFRWGVRGGLTPKERAARAGYVG